MSVITHREGRIYTVVASGSYSTLDLRRALEDILAREDFPPDARIMLDIRAADSVVHRRVDELRSVTEHFLSHADRFGGQAAIVVRGAARYGLMRMAATWAELAGVHVFVTRDVDEARARLLHG